MACYFQSSGPSNGQDEPGVGLRVSPGELWGELENTAMVSRLLGTTLVPSSTHKLHPKTF